MSRRKDNKGRVLRTGESQRKDLIYQYRYTDALGNRKCIYASDLKTLREKEDELQKSLEDGLDYGEGMTLTCIGFRPLPDEIAHQISHKFHLY